jgi:hypothetical protein
MGIFFHWLFKAKHTAMRYNFKLIIKWVAIFLVVQTAVALFLVFIDDALLIAMIPAYYFASQLTAFLLYGFKWIEKYELYIPLIFWGPAIVLYLYKKHQTAPLHEDPQKAE